MESPSKVLFKVSECNICTGGRNHHGRAIYRICDVYSRLDGNTTEPGKEVLSVGHRFLLALAIGAKNCLWASSFIRAGRIWICF